MTNAPGKDAYPICGATWLLVYEQQKDPAKGKKLVEFLKWAAKDGEKMATDLQICAIAGQCSAACPETNRRDQNVAKCARRAACRC